MSNGPAKSPSITSRIKLALILILIILVAIVIIQNRESVDTQLLFVTVSMPRALLLIVTLLIGLVAGVVFSAAYLKRK